MGPPEAGQQISLIIQAKPYMNNIYTRTPDVKLMWWLFANLKGAEEFWVAGGAFGEAFGEAIARFIARALASLLNRGS